MEREKNHPATRNTKCKDSNLVYLVFFVPSWWLGGYSEVSIE
jgi:hypothetical protein